MSRFITLTFALTIAAALLNQGHAQQTNNSAGPGQTGATGSNSAGPAQSGAASNSAGPSQTGAAPPPQINPTPVPGRQPASRVQAGNPSSPAPGQLAPRAGQGPSPFQNAPGQNQPANAQLPAGTQPPAFVQQFGAIRQRPWFNDPGIRQQLRLQDQQIEQLSRGYADAWTNYNQNLLQLQQDLNRGERLRRQNALRGNFQQEFSSSVDSTLTDPALRNRFQQLYLQHQGYGAFDDVALRQRMRLTPSQQMQFHRLNQEWNAQLVALNQTFGSDRAAALRQYNQLRDQMATGVNSVLTADQRRLWAQLIGTPYNFEGDVVVDANNSLSLTNQAGVNQTGGGGLNGTNPSVVNPNANNPVGNNQAPNSPPTSNQPVPPNGATLR